MIHQLLSGGALLGIPGKCQRPGDRGQKFCDNSGTSEDCEDYPKIPENNVWNITWPVIQIRIKLCFTMLYLLVLFSFDNGHSKTNDTYSIIQMTKVN